MLSWASSTLLYISVPLWFSIPITQKTQCQWFPFPPRWLAALRQVDLSRYLASVLFVNSELYASNHLRALSKAGLGQCLDLLEQSVSRTLVVVIYTYQWLKHSISPPKRSGPLKKDALKYRVDAQSQARLLSQRANLRHKCQIS